MALNQNWEDQMPELVMAYLAWKHPLSTCPRHANTANTPNTMPADVHHPDGNASPSEPMAFEHPVTEDTRYFDVNAVQSDSTCAIACNNATFY